MFQNFKPLLKVLSKLKRLNTEKETGSLRENVEKS